MRLLAAVLVTSAVLISSRRDPTRSRAPAAPRGGWSRLVASVLAVAATWAVFGGWIGIALGLVAAVGADRVLADHAGRAARARAARLRADLPLALELLTAVVASGAAVESALAEVAGAVPGPVADEFGGIARRLQVGVSSDRVFGDLVEDRSLAPLGRALARAHRSGAAVGPSLLVAAEELRAKAASEAEVRARSVSTRAAVPLGLCLLPAFVLVGIVPLVAGLVSDLHLLAP